MLNSTTETSYVCKYPGCKNVLSVKLEDELGNTFCSEHFQLLLKAKNSLIKTEESDSKANDTKLLLD